jgi:ABC-2 type transport system ATP-binding protein
MTIGLSIDRSFSCCTPGPNGAGKTTLMKILATLLLPTSGKIVADGIDRIQQPQKIRELLGYLPQDFGFYGNLTGEEMLDFVACMKDVKNRKQKVSEVLDRVGLSNVRKRKTRHYSGGMKQRLGIAQALLGEPRLLVVDEPTAGLDPEERIRFRNILAEIGTDTTVLLSTHIVGDIESLCADMAIIKAGKIIFRGTCAEAIRRVEGKVWNVQLDPKLFDEVKRDFKIISFQRTHDSINARVVADENPRGLGTPAEADLEAAYVHIIERA